MAIMLVALEVHLELALMVGLIDMVSQVTMTETSVVLKLTN
jgi:hypothetical protein